MKISRISLLLLSVTLLGMLITPVFANGDIYYSDLIAGQHYVVGDVTITFNDPHTMLIITIETTDCDIVETHVWVGDDLGDVPRTKKGNPKIGQFPEVPITVSDKMVVYEVDISSLGSTLYLIVHAVVDCPCLGEETAFGEGIPQAALFETRPDIFGSRWGYFIEIPKFA
jgi:hypothetical protein